jgi:hypothetical protein
MHYGAIQHVFFEMTYFIMKLGEYICMYYISWFNLALVIWSENWSETDVKSFEGMISRP